MSENQTHMIASWVARTKADDIPDNVFAWARHCVLDWIAVTIAGANDPDVNKLVDLALSSGFGTARVIGHGTGFESGWSVAINGMAGHVLDYDDVNERMVGHPTAAILPAILNAAQEEGSPARDLLAALVVGHQVASALGALMGPGHYAAGFHATATLGAIAAACGVGHLLRLDTDQQAHAIGFATAQAAGLKAMFGTSAKPFQVGRAAQAGYLAARIAASGMTARTDALEAENGFISTHAQTDAVDLEIAPDPDFAITRTLFKFHAACYLTHATMDALAGLRRRHNLSADDVRAIRLQVHPGILASCNIPDPQTALETKFSLRHTAAMAVAGTDTAGLASYSDDMAAHPGLIDLRNRVTVEPQDWPQDRMMIGIAEIDTADGQTLTAQGDSGRPLRDINNQWRRLSDKALTLVSPVTGKEKARALIDAVASFDTTSALMEACP